MLHKTTAIVINSVKYGETSLISKIYTREFGVQSYIINGVRSSKGGQKAGLLQPLSILDLVVYHKEGKNIKRISDIKSAYAFRSIPFDVIKGSIALFLVEILGKSLREEEKNENQFDFIQESVKYLDQTSDSVFNFHVWFITHLTRFLGFFPETSSAGNHQYFDLEDGVFSEKAPGHCNYIKAPISILLSRFITCDLPESQQIDLSREQRRELLDWIVKYYQLHLERFSKVRSPKILEELF